MFYIFTSENITFSKYAFYFINNSLYFITLYIIKYTNLFIFSKVIERKPFFKVEKKAITPKIIGGFYPKSNLTYIL